VTHLRQIMLEELRRRNYAESTIHAYIHTVEHFSRHSMPSWITSRPPTTCQQTVKNHFLGSERQISQPFRACSAGDDTCSTLHDSLYARGIIRLDRCHKFEIDKV